MAVSETCKYRYRLDANDVLVEVDARWLAFARENGAMGLNRDAVLGRSIWEFIKGETVIAIYKAIHERVRRDADSAVFPFRCDSPNLRRYMRMTITPGRHGELLYETVMERAIPQRPLAMLDAQRPRSAQSLDVCSCCKRAMLEGIGWLDLEDVSFRLGLLEAASVPEVRHALCPRCANAIHNSSNGSDVA